MIEMASFERYRNDHNRHQREPMEALTPLLASSWRAFDNAAGTFVHHSGRANPFFR